MITNKSPRFIVLFFILFVVLASTKFAVWKLNDGFSVQNIKLHNIDEGKIWEVNPLTSQERKALDDILNQEFTYLAKGHQSYVFESEDKKYVIKFLKFQRYYLNPIYAKLPLPQTLADKREKRKIIKQIKLDRLFNSWIIANNHLKEQTGIIYLHLNRTEDLQKQLTIIDRLGFSHQIDLDSTVFMLQKKTDMMSTRIETLLALGEHEKVNVIIDNLKEMYRTQFRMGISDEDYHPLRNTGIDGWKIVAIDPGQLVWDEKVKDPEVQEKLLLKKTEQIRLKEELNDER